jgi:hypothetical protein
MTVICKERFGRINLMERVHKEDPDIRWTTAIKIDLRQ